MELAYAGCEVSAVCGKVGSDARSNSEQHRSHKAEPFSRA
jgi:hypothetical protein